MMAGEQPSLYNQYGSHGYISHSVRYCCSGKPFRALGRMHMSVVHAHDVLDGPVRQSLADNIDMPCAPYRTSVRWFLSRGAPLQKSELNIDTHTVEFFWIRPGQNIMIVFTLRPVF